MKHLEDVLPPGLELAHDITPASWMVEGLRPWGQGHGVPVASVVPDGFASYALIKHAADSIEGSIPRDTLGALVTVLRDFTASEDLCWFCIWDGYGFWFTGSHKTLVHPRNADTEATLDRVSEERDRTMRQAPVVKGHARDYFLFSGHLSAGTSLERYWEGPNIWWPDDRSWCIGTDIDRLDSFVAGSRECIERIVDAAGLDATEVSPDDDANELHKW